MRPELGLPGGRGGAWGCGRARRAGPGVGGSLLRDGALCVGTAPPILIQFFFFFFLRPPLIQFFYPLSSRASISRDPFYDMLATRKRRIANKK